MNPVSAKRPPRKQAGFLYSLAVLLVAAIAIYWAFVALFPNELRDTWHWLQATARALLK